MSFFIKKLVSLIVRMRTNRVRTVLHKLDFFSEVSSIVHILWDLFWLLSPFSKYSRYTSVFL